MKPEFFTKLAEEGSVRINVPRAVAIERLTELNGICREADCVGNDLSFNCDKNGKFYVREAYSRHNLSGPETVIVCGEIKEDGNKSEAVYRVYKRKAPLTTLILYMLLMIVLMAACIFLLIMKTEVFSIKSLFVIIAASVIILSVIPLTAKGKKYSAKDIEVMKNEIFTRIDAVEKWDK